MAIQQSLRDEVRELYNNRSDKVLKTEVSEAIGVSISWLNTFARGEIQNPGVMTIEALKAYLLKRTQGE